MELKNFEVLSLKIFQKSSFAKFSKNRNLEELKIGKVIADLRDCAQRYEKL
ncbi:hypothetical protein HYU23_01810 [Candidatus Woesearchaeota archaeon]|nr:hypothetical protein [Candidatus Woesearchaeota archaeon]